MFPCVKLTTMMLHCCGWLQWCFQACSGWFCIKLLHTLNLALCTMNIVGTNCLFFSSFLGHLELKGLLNVNLCKLLTDQVKKACSLGAVTLAKFQWNFEGKKWFSVNISATGDIY